MSAMQGEAEKSAWVTRVLGVTVAAPEDGADEDDDTAILPLWRDARDQAGDQIGRLQVAMRGIDLPVLHRIADAGLNGITGRLQVGIQAALMDFDRTPPEARPDAAGKVRKSIDGLRGFLDSDRIVALLEDNPLGVDVSLRRTLGAALDAIEARLPHT